MSQGVLALNHEVLIDTPAIAIIVIFHKNI
jgi:hypothetical protein